MRQDGMDRAFSPRTIVGSTPGAMRQADIDRAFSPRTILGSTPGAMRPAGIDRAFSPRDYRRFRTWRDAPGWYGSALQSSANGSDDRSTFEERTHRSAKGANDIRPGRSPGMPKQTKDESCKLVP